MIEYEIKPQKGLSLNLKELWEYKELLYFFSWRDIKVKYKQAVLGFLWAILQPLFTMLIFTFFFGKMLEVPSDGVPYPVFAFTGLIIWNLFSSGLTGAGNSMVSNANIIQKIYFPRLIIPISSIVVSFFDFLMSLIIFIPLMLYFDIHIYLIYLICFFPLSIFFTLLTTFGIGSFIAALNVKYRDFRYILPFLIQSFLFLTPVIYPVSIIKYDWAKYLIAINPMTGAIDLARSSLIDKPLDVNLILISGASSFLFFLVGLLYFRRTERYFADIV